MLARANRGDTIIEVMFAFVIFSLVVVSAFSIMNKGVATAQRSLEVTLVRQQIDGQVAMVQHIQQTNPILWTKIKSLVVDTTGVFGTETQCPEAKDLLDKSDFFIAATSDGSAPSVVHIQSDQDYKKATAYSMVDVFGRTSTTSTPVAYGLYMRMVKSDGWSDTNHSYDLNVRACWDSIGVNVPVTIGTVVRLFDAN